MVFFNHLSQIWYYLILINGLNNGIKRIYSIFADNNDLERNHKAYKIRD